MINDGIKKTELRPLSFLMIGQSNMAGRGDIGEVEPIVNDKCYMLRMGRWQKMSEPINVDRGPDAAYKPGIGLAASFADSVSKYYDRAVGLIPCADGGTAIKQWMPGTILYDHAVFMAKLAMRTSDFAGIIWHQGENDCHSFERGYYKRSFIEMMTALRCELGAEQLPLIIGELAHNINHELYQIEIDAPMRMNELLREIAVELPNCALALSDGLKLRHDEIHFSAASCREFGIRYFEKYREIIEK